MEPLFIPLFTTLDPIHHSPYISSSSVNPSFSLCVEAAKPLSFYLHQKLTSNFLISCSSVFIPPSCSYFSHPLHIPYLFRRLRTFLPLSLDPPYIIHFTSCFSPSRNKLIKNFTIHLSTRTPIHSLIVPTFNLMFTNCSIILSSNASY